MPFRDIQKVKNIGVAHSTGTAVLSLSITVPTGGVAVGNKILVHGTIAANRTATVADSKGNTYTVRADVANASNNTNLFLADSQVTTALVAGDTITVTMDATAHFVVIASEWFGIDTFGALQSTESI